MKSFLCIALLFATPVLAQDDKPKAKPTQSDKAKPKKKKQPKNKMAFLNAKGAGPDFAVQSEYVGAVHDGREKMGMQVIARGDGKFEAYAYPGGLPGAGWNQEMRLKFEGETKDGVTTLTSQRGSAKIKDGNITGYNTDGDKIGDLKKVTRKSPTLGKKPPEGAVVLFDGKSADLWKNGKVINGMLKEGMTSKPTFGSCKLHLEFMLSYMPYARGQGRSNSGCYMQGRYETQILDSFGLTGEQNECGGIYGIAKPKVNMCLPPLSWQTYDIEFRAAKFDKSGKKTEDARMTVRHNGVLIHDKVRLTKSTTASPVKEGTEQGPIYIQNHGNPLRFRNIWVEPIEG